MQRATKITLCGFAAAIATASVAAQINGTLTPARVPPEQVERAARPALATELGAVELPIDILAIQAFEMGEVLTGRPFMADVFTERIQTLSDGNRIVRRSTGRMLRDSHGRTRREQEISGVVPTVAALTAHYVLINDPVEDVSIVIDERARHAVRAPLIRVSPAPVAAPDSARGAPTNSTAARPDGLSLRNQELGEKVVNGVRAIGSRSIATLGPGAVGNELPLIITTDRWEAIDLEVLVSSRTHDPRFGDTLYELRNISFVEPPGSLFAAPSGYTLDSTGIAGR